MGDLASRPLSREATAPHAGLCSSSYTDNHPWLVSMPSTLSTQDPACVIIPMAAQVPRSCKCNPSCAFPYDTRLCPGRFRFCESMIIMLQPLLIYFALLLIILAESPSRTTITPGVESVMTSPRDPPLVNESWKIHNRWAGTQSV